MFRPFYTMVLMSPIINIGIYAFKYPIDDIDHRG